MVRIAALAAGLVMAGAAWADTMGTTQPTSNLELALPECGHNDSGCGVVLGTPAPKPAHCLPGWTLVYAETAHFGNVPKCAAVGDLRDPE